MDEMIRSTYGQKVRVRVCGLCFRNDSLLMIKHKGLGKQGILWSPPGGGLAFGESSEACLVREFKEETGLEVEPTQFLFVNEFISKDLQAIELFFSVRIKKGALIKGNDPETSQDHQIIQAVRFVTFEELKIMPTEIKHNIFQEIEDIRDLLNIRGYFKFWQ